MKYRKVVDWDRSIAPKFNSKHTDYTLECGHVVRRETSNTKRYAFCGLCD